MATTTATTNRAIVTISILFHNNASYSINNSDMLVLIIEYFVLPCQCVTIITFVRHQCEYWAFWQMLPYSSEREADIQAFKHNFKNLNKILRILKDFLNLIKILEFKRIFGIFKKISI